MKFKITQEMIDTGKPGGCFDCPVALALLKHFYHVKVNVIEVSVYMKNSKTVTYKTSKKLQDFIRRFDNNLSVNPNEFELAKNSLDI